jgi:SAM-dependent methyltransferase
VTPDRYTHGHHESVLRSHRWRTAENSAAFLLPHLVEGMTLLDVGCGPGNITAELATFVGEGDVTGIDLAPEVIAMAKKDFPSSQHENLFFEVGDVYALDFPDFQFDVVYVHQVLQHLSDPVAALTEIRRVLKPEGVVAVRDADFGAFAWSPTDPLLTRWIEIYHQLTRRNNANADAGRELLHWAHAAGFEDVEYSSTNWTFATPEGRAFWGGLWADRIRHSEFARQSLEYELTNEAELEEIANAFHRWIDDEDGVFIAVHGEILARR